MPLNEPVQPVIVDQVETFYDGYQLSEMMSDEAPSALIDFRKREREFICNLLGSDSKKVLEVGCGDGGWLEWLDQAGHQVTGIDISSTRVKNARDRVSSPEVQIHRADVRSLPFETGSFDVVLGIGNFIGNLAIGRRQAITEMIRVSSDVTAISLFSPSARDVQLANYQRIGLPGLQESNNAFHSSNGFFSMRFSESDIHDLCSAFPSEVFRVSPISFCVVSRKLHLC